jgi:threonine dehydratase
VVGRDEVEAASERIAGRVRETPTLELEPHALGPGSALVLKLELLQRTASFKLRGAFSALLAAEVPPAGIVAASGGNFGVAAATAAQDLDLPAAIFVPEASPPAKVARLRSTSAEVFVTGALYDDSLAASREHAAATGALEVHAFDDPAIVAGQGTCGRELDRQRPGLDTVLVAVGGGGLCAGVAAWFAGSARVIAVEPAAAPTYAEALAAGGPVEVEVSGIASDSLGARRLGDHPWALMRRWDVGSLLVADEAIRDAQRRLWAAARVAAEPGGATAVAALTAGAYVPRAGERVAAIVSGGNFDPGDLA